MSTTSKILTGAAFAAALVLATIGTASAQSRGGGGGPAGGGGADPTIPLTYGLPGNCPPTLAGCNPPEQQQLPKPKKLRKIDKCGDYAPGTAARRECQMRMP